jgi:methylated-DNA-[protein]-cysteine S-methyltransferase
MREELVATPVGPCRVTSRNGRICRIRMGGKGPPSPSRGPGARGLAAWFAGRNVGVRLDLEGVPAFHRRVYEVVRRIPPGRTRTYGEVARQAGRPGAARAVGQAMARNPIPFFIP